MKIGTLPIATKKSIDSRRIHGHTYLPLLRFRLKEEILKRQKEKYGNVEESNVEAKSNV